MFLRRNNVLIVEVRIHVLKRKERENE